MTPRLLHAEVRFTFAVDDGEHLYEVSTQTLVISAGMWDHFAGHGLDDAAEAVGAHVADGAPNRP